MNRIDAILLAAGESSRFGSDKRRYLLPHGAILHCALDPVVGAVRSVFVVLRAEDQQDLAALLGHHANDCRVQVLLLADAAAGMGCNLARAVAQLPPDSEGVLVALADMPYLQAQTVQEIVASFVAGKIVQPVFVDEAGHEHRGHPVLFARSFFPLLEKLSGDTGARAVLQTSADSLILLPVPDEGILRDVDVCPD